MILFLIFLKVKKNLLLGLFEQFGSTDPALNYYNIQSHITDNEKVYGTRFNDVIEGGDSNQDIYLFGGNDTVNGQGGIDIVQINDLSSNLTLIRNPNLLHFTNGEENKYLTNVEYVQV